jgi:Raf kinase inhibitor-like YbhB/YbcL family protein
MRQDETMEDKKIKRITKLHLLIVIVLIAAAFSACSSKNQNIEPEQTTRIEGIAAENLHKTASDQQPADSTVSVGEKKEENMETFTLTSVYQNGGDIPSKYAYFGVPGAENTSLPLKWIGAPADTKSFAILFYDLHPVAKEWVHWAIINIPSSADNIDEGASNTQSMPKGSIELTNSYGEKGYGGPCPPKGSGKHEYKFIIYALNTDKIDLSGKMSAKKFQDALKDKILGTAELSGYFEQ